MKVAILAGGKGTRLAEETGTKSKAMVRIGDEPVLWHVMKYYEHYGLSRFVIALGYQADSIRAYFETLGTRRTSVQDGQSSSLTRARTRCPAGASSGWHPTSTRAPSC
jgi:NDP-sugar pyrophosphorylase family protein